MQVKHHNYSHSVQRLSSSSVIIDLEDDPSNCVMHDQHMYTSHNTVQAKLDLAMLKIDF